MEKKSTRSKTGRTWNDTVMEIDDVVRLWGEK